MLSVVVVLATYNGERYLREQLDSLAAQTRHPDHLLVSDDGSTDSTCEIVRSFAADAPFPVRLAQRESRLGPQVNFARAVEEVEGDVLFFCDQDDRWHPDKIATVLARFEQDDRLGMVMNDAIMTDDRLRPIGRTLFEQHGLDERDLEGMSSGHAFRVFATKMQPYGSTLALRLDVAKASLPLPDGQTYDQWIGQLASLTAGVTVLQDPKQEYRQHSAQVTGLAPGSRLSQALRRRRSHNRGELTRDIRRLQQLQQRLGGMDQSVPAIREAVALTSGRLRLEQRRERIRSSLVSRPPAVALLLLTGAYHRHARGFRSAGLDLVAQR